MKYECLRPKCGHKWNPKIRHSPIIPQCCPVCHSRSWNVAPPAKVTSCAKCGKAFKKGMDVYRLIEGTSKNGVFVPGKNYGDFCDNCIPDEDALPWSK